MYGAEPEDVITLRLRAVPAGDEILFKFRRGTKMQKIFNAYASKKGVPEHSLRFLLDGERISPSLTAEALEIEDNDVVEVFTGSNMLDSSTDSVGGEQLSVKQQQLESMKAVIINELEENVSSSLAVSPLSSTDDTLELCADRDNILNSDVLHIAALYGIDERFTNYESKPFVGGGAAAVATTSGSKTRDRNRDRDRDKDCEGSSMHPTDSAFERALSSMEPLVQAMKDWDYVGSGNSSGSGSGSYGLGSVSGADLSELTELSTKEKMLALKIPEVGFQALLESVKIARPGLHKALSSHVLVSGVNSSKQRGRRSKDKDKERQKGKERKREKERRGIADSKETRESSSVPSSVVSTEAGSEEISPTPTPAFFPEDEEELEEEDDESPDFQKKILLSIVSKAIADGSTQAILFAVLMLYQSREKNWLSPPSTIASAAVSTANASANSYSATGDRDYDNSGDNDDATANANTEVQSSASDREVEELNNSSATTTSTITTNATPSSETLPIGAMISLLFESLHVSNNSADGAPDLGSGGGKSGVASSLASAAATIFNEDSKPSLNPFVWNYSYAQSLSAESKRSLLDRRSLSSSDGGGGGCGYGGLSPSTCTSHTGTVNTGGAHYPQTSDAGSSSCGLSDAGSLFEGSSMFAEHGTETASVSEVAVDHERDHVLDNVEEDSLVSAIRDRSAEQIEEETRQQLQLQQEQEDDHQEEDDYDEDDEDAMLAQALALSMQDMEQTTATAAAGAGAASVPSGSSDSGSGIPKDDADDADDSSDTWRYSSSPSKFRFASPSSASSSTAKNVRAMEKQLRGHQRQRQLSFKAPVVYPEVPIMSAFAPLIQSTYLKSLYALNLPSSEESDYQSEYRYDEELSEMSTMHVIIALLAYVSGCADASAASTAGSASQLFSSPGQQIQTLELSSEHKVAIVPSATTLMLLELLLDMFVNEYRVYNENLADDHVEKLDRVDFAAMIAKLRINSNNTPSDVDDATAPTPSKWSLNCDAGQFTPYVYTWVISTLLKLLNANLVSALDTRMPLSNIGMHKSGAHILIDSAIGAMAANSSDITAYLDRSRLMASEDSQYFSPSVLPLPYLVERAIMACGGCADMSRRDGSQSACALLDSIKVNNSEEIASGVAADQSRTGTIFSPLYYRHILRLVSMDVYATGYAMFYPTIKERELRLQIMLHSTPNAADNINSDTGGGLKSAILWSANDFRVSIAQNNEAAMMGCVIADSASATAYYKLYRLQRCCLAACKWNLLKCHTITRSSGGRDVDRDDGRCVSASASGEAPVSDRWSHILVNSAPSDTLSRCSVGVGCSYSEANAPRHGHTTASASAGGTGCGTNKTEQDTERRVMLEYLRNLLPAGMVAQDSALERLCGALVGDDVVRKAALKQHQSNSDSAAAVGTGTSTGSSNASANDPTAMTPTTSSSDLVSAGESAANRDSINEQGTGCGGSASGRSSSDPDDDKGISSSIELAARLPSVQQLLLSRLEHGGISTISSAVRLVGVAADGTVFSPSPVSSSRYMYYGELSLLKLYQLRHNVMFINSCASSSSMIGTGTLKKMLWNPLRCEPLLTRDVDGASTVLHSGPKHWHTAYAECGFAPNTGVYEWGIRVNKCDKNHVFAGVCGSEADRTTYLGGNSSSWGLIGTKALWHSRMKVRTDYGDSWGTDCTIYARLDTNARTLSFSTDNSDWGVAFEGLPSTVLYPAVSLYQKGDSVSIFNVSAPPSNGTGIGAANATVGSGNEYLNDSMARCVVQADFIVYARSIIQSVCKIADAVDTVGSAVSMDNLATQQQLLAHPLITVLFPSMCAAISLSHMKLEHAGFCCLQLLPYLLVLSKRLAGLHEKYFNSSVGTAAVADKDSKMALTGFPVTNTNVAANINGGWWMKSSSNLTGGRGVSHVLPQQYYIELSCSPMSSGLDSAEGGNAVDAEVIGSDYAFVVSGTGGIPMDAGAVKKDDDGSNLVTVDGALIGTRMKFAETWSGGHSMCAVEGRVSLDGGYFIGKYRDCKNASVHGNIEGFRVNGASREIRPNLLLKSAYMSTLACGKLIGSLVVGLSSVALDDALFAAVPAVTEEAVASQQQQEEEESKEERTGGSDAEVSRASENRHMGNEEALSTSTSAASTSTSAVSSPSPLPLTSQSPSQPQVSPIVVLHDDEIKWLRSDLFAGGLPLTNDMQQYLYQEIASRTSLNNFTDLIVSKTGSQVVQGLLNDPAAASSTQSQSESISPVVLWWLLRVFPSLAEVIRKNNDLGDAVSGAVGAGTGVLGGDLHGVPGISAYSANRSAFLSTHILDRKPLPSVANANSTAVLDDYVTHHVGQSMFLKLGGGQVFQAARRLVLAALIKHSGCVSLCRAEYDSLCDGSRSMDERPCELIIEIWRATQRVIEFWVPQKAALKLSFAEIAAIVSNKASFLLELESNVACQRLEDNLSMIPIALISVSSELRKQSVNVPDHSNTQQSVSVSVREIEKQGSQLLTEATSFLMSNSTQDVSPLRAEMLKASLRSVSRTAGLKSFMLLYSSKLDDCPYFDETEATGTTMMYSPTSDAGVRKQRLWSSSQLPPLSSLVLQPLAAQHIIFALHGVNDIDAWKQAQAATATAASTSAGGSSGGRSSASASSSGSGSSKLAEPTALSPSQLFQKRKRQQKLLSECNGHYSDGLKGCSLVLGDEVKQSFDVVYEHITQLLQRCIWGNDRDGQCVTLACWGLTIRPQDHLFLNRVGIFRTLQSVLDESRATLSKLKNAGTGAAAGSNGSSINVTMAKNVFPVALNVNSVKRLSQLVLKVVHSLASQVAFAPEKPGGDSGSAAEKRSPGTPAASISPLPTGLASETGSFRLQRLPSGPDTLSSSLFDLLYSELFNSLKHVIMLTIRSNSVSGDEISSQSPAPVDVTTTGIAVSPMSMPAALDSEAAAHIANLTAAVNLAVRGQRDKKKSSNDGSPHRSSGGPGSRSDDEDLVGEQYIYRMLRLLHSVANSVICQKILCSPKWLSLLIAGVGCGGLGIQRRLLKLLRRLLVLSDAKNVKAFVSSLFSERDEFICSDTALDEEDVESLIWSQENYSAEQDALLLTGEHAEPGAVSSAGVDLKESDECGYDYWSQAKTASERIIVMLLEGASVILPTSAGTLDVNSLFNHLHSSNLCNVLSSEAVSFIRVLQGSPDWREVVETVLHRYLKTLLPLPAAMTTTTTTAAAAVTGKDTAITTAVSKPFDHADDELKLRMVAVSLGVYGGFIDSFRIGGLVNLRPFGLVGVAESFSLKLAAISHSCGMLVGLGPNHADVVLMEQNLMYSTIKDSMSGENRTILQHSTSMAATLPLKPVRMGSGDVFHTNDVTPIPEFVSDVIFDDVVALLLGSCLPTIEDLIKDVKMGSASTAVTRPYRGEDEADHDDEEEGEWQYGDDEEDDEDEEGARFSETGEDDEEAERFRRAMLHSSGLEADLIQFTGLDGGSGTGASAVSASTHASACTPAARRRSSSRSTSSKGSKNRSRSNSKTGKAISASASANAVEGNDDSIMRALKLLTSTYCFRTFSNSMQNISLIKLLFAKYPELIPKLLSMATATSSCGGVSVVEQVEQRWTQLWDAYVLLNHNVKNAPADGTGAVETNGGVSLTENLQTPAPSTSVLSARGASADRPVTAGGASADRPVTAGGGSGLFSSGGSGLFSPRSGPGSGSGSRLERPSPPSQVLRREPSVPTLPPMMHTAPPIIAPVMRQADPDAVAQMMEMGLQQSWCEFALRRCRNNVEMAINLCFEQSGDMDQLIAEEAAMNEQMQARARARAAEAASPSSGSTTYHRTSRSGGSEGRATLHSSNPGGDSTASRITQLFSRVLQHRTNSNSAGGGGDMYSTPPSTNERTGLGSTDAGSLITHLMELGFPPHWCLRALAASGNDADAALSWIASHGEELVSEAESAGRGSGGLGLADLGALASLTSLGGLRLGGAGASAAGGVPAVDEFEAAEVADGPKRPVYRGPNPLICVSGSCTIDDELTCTLPNANGGFPSVGCRGFPVSSGKWYYELVLKTAGCVQLGWVDLAYIGGAEAGEGVGDDCHSWAYDGWRVYAWHERSMDWGAAWSPGDVVGCGVDLDNHTISFYLNGFAEEVGMGIAYRSIQFSGGLYPCASFNRNETIQFNFGATPFRYPAPEGYSPYIDHIRERVKQSQVLAEDLDQFFVNLTATLAAADINSSLPQDLAVIAESKRAGKSNVGADSDAKLDAEAKSTADQTSSVVTSAAAEAIAGVNAGSDAKESKEGEVDDSEDLGDLNSVYRYLYEDCMEECRGETHFPVGARYFPQDEGGSQSSRLLGGFGTNERTLRFPTPILPAGGVPAMVSSNNGATNTTHGVDGQGTYTSVEECREAILTQFAQLSKDLCILYARISLVRAFGSYALVGCPTSLTQQLTLSAAVTDADEAEADAKQASDGTMTAQAGKQQKKSIAELLYLMRLSSMYTGRTRVFLHTMSLLPSTSAVPPNLGSVCCAGGAPTLHLMKDSLGAVLHHVRENSQYMDSELMTQLLANIRLDTLRATRREYTNDYKIDNGYVAYCVARNGSGTHSGGSYQSQYGGGAAASGSGTAPDIDCLTLPDLSLATFYTVIVLEQLAAESLLMEGHGDGSSSDLKKKTEQRDCIIKWMVSLVECWCHTLKSPSMTVKLCANRILSILIQEASSPGSRFGEVQSQYCSGNSNSNNNAASNVSIASEICRRLCDVVPVDRLEGLTTNCLAMERATLPVCSEYLQSITELSIAARNMVNMSTAAVSIDITTSVDDSTVNSSIPESAEKNNDTVPSFNWEADGGRVFTDEGWMMWTGSVTQLTADWSGSTVRPNSPSSWSDQGRQDRPPTLLPGCYVISKKKYPIPAPSSAGEKGNHRGACTTERIPNLNAAAASFTPSPTPLASVPAAAAAAIATMPSSSSSDIGSIPGLSDILSPQSIASPTILAAETEPRSQSQSQTEADTQADAEEAAAVEEEAAAAEQIRRLSGQENYNSSDSHNDDDDDEDEEDEEDDDEEHDIYEDEEEDDDEDEHEHDTDDALEQAQQSIFEQMVAAMRSGTSPSGSRSEAGPDSSPGGRGSGGLRGASASGVSVSSRGRGEEGGGSSDISSPQTPCRSADPVAEHRRGIVVGVTTWKGDGASGTSNCVDPELLTVCNGNARVIKWEGQEEPEVVRWGAEGVYDVIHVAVDKRKQAAALANPNPPATPAAPATPSAHVDTGGAAAIESSTTRTTSVVPVTVTPAAPSVGMLFPSNAILKQYPSPVSAKQKAVDRLFGTQQSFGVILRLRELPFVAKPVQDLCDSTVTDVDEGIVAKYDGVLEWPDFNTIVYVTAHKYAGNTAELEVKEQRLLTPSEGNASWTIRFGVNRWTPSTFYLTPPNASIAGASSAVTGLRAHRTADNKKLNSDYLGQFAYVARVGEMLPQEKVTIAGTMELQQSNLFHFDEKLKNKVFCLSHEKMMASNNPGGGRGMVFGNIGFSIGVHYWEFKIEHADIGSIFLGVCEKPSYPGVGFTSHMQQSCNKWYGAGYINHRASFKRGINMSATERSAVYGDHFQIGDTVGVLLDMNKGKLSFFLDGMKYGEHIIQDLGEAFDSLTNVSSVHRKVYYPVVGFQKSQDRVVITPRWLSSIGSNVHSDFELIGKASKLLTTWSLQRQTSKPLESDMWVYRDSWRDWRRWIAGRYMRVKSRCNAATMLVVVDTLPLSCVEASIGLGLQTALFHGDRIIFTKSCGRQLDTKEEGVILGAYRKKLWYRLDNQTSSETVTEGGGLAWCLAACDVEGLQLVRRATGERNLGALCDILLPRTPEHAGGRIIVSYEGGAVMRNGLEIDAAESICTIPSDTILFATEKRVNSSNVVRYHVVYEQHYGWISERTRGGQEDMMVTVLRNSTEEEIEEVRSEAKAVLDRFYSKVASPSSPALPENSSTSDASSSSDSTSAAATVLKTNSNPYTRVKWLESSCLEEAVEAYLQSVCEYCQTSSGDAMNKLLGTGGILCDGYLPEAELDYLQSQQSHSSAAAGVSEGGRGSSISLVSFANAVSGYSYSDFVELASKMVDTTGIDTAAGVSNNNNWTVEADMQLAELLTRCAGRERVTPQNLSCVALEKSVKLLDLSKAFPSLKDVPIRRLLARASVMRVANQVLEYALPYLPTMLPEEKWSYNRIGSEDELSIHNSNKTPLSVLGMAAAATATTTSSGASSTTSSSDDSARRHLFTTGGVCTCSSCANVALYNSVDYGKTCDTAASGRLDKFPDDMGIERKMRDVTETWHPICGARKLRNMRRLIFASTKRSFWESICDATATPTPLPQDEYEDPHQIKTIKINRIKAAVPNLAALPSAHDRIKHSIFGQLHKELRSWNNSSFRRAYISKGHGGQKRAFKVKFLGEGVNDYGGPYRAVFESVIDELQSDNAIVGRKISERTLLPLLVPCPNRSSGVSSNQDKYLLSPAPTSPLSQEYMQFLGKLIGMSVRHNITLGMTASSLLWRPLVKQAVSQLQLATVDTLICNQMSEVEKLGLELEDKAKTSRSEYAPDFQPEEWKDLVFATYLSDGTRLPLIPRGEDVGINLSNWRQYVSFVERTRLREGALMFKVFRDGLSTVLPTELLPLFTPVELEQLICGNSTVDVQLLKQCTEYEDGLSPDTPLVKWFWEILTEMSNEERTLFLRFVWARSRMPASLSELSMNFKLQLASHNASDDMKSNPDCYLPSAQTCFFSLALPKYTCKVVLREKLLYAIENSPNMDADVRMHSAEGWDA